MAAANFENIEQYLNGELSPAELTVFEAQLKESLELRQQLEAYKETTAILDRHLNMSAEERDFRTTLKNKRLELPTTVATSKSRLLKVWGAVAAVAAILLVVWSPWQVSILDRYGKLEMTSPVVRGDSQDIAQAKIVSLYNGRHFKQVALLLDSAVKADPTNAQQVFYRGATYLNLHRREEARRDLESVYNGGSIYKYEGAYFTALSFRIDQQMDSCRSWLQKIPADAAIYPKAKKLLQEVASK